MQLLTAKDVKEELKISKATVYNLAKSGKLPSVKILAPGGKALIRFKPEDVKALVEECYGQNSVNV
ncbi:MAG: helix-turn-helix domain-containing protein [Desulfobacteraceae bacterium]|jgi:excisionase family DNA binding protein